MQPKESAAFAYHFKRHALHRLSFGVRCQGTMPAVLTKTNLFCAAVYMATTLTQDTACKHTARFFSNTCAASICVECDDHKGLVRCWCGWSSTGGNGHAELIEAGETIEAEDY